MDIMRVRDELVCTRRVQGLQSASLRVLESQLGELVCGHRCGGRA
jgi:ethanolamine utilization protein EutN